MVKQEKTAEKAVYRRALTDDQVEIDEVRFPDLSDLIARLRFSTVDGRIWLDDQRMLLIHAHAFGSFRRELIESVGFDNARRLLTRMGYLAGAQDAQMARKIRSGRALKDMFVVGPQMHCLEGIGLSSPVRLEFNVEKGTHYGEFIWTHQVEDEEHIRHFPVSSEPTCWMQIGYASGYSTEFMGKPILYREIECQAMGHTACRIVGKPVDAWGEKSRSDLRYLMEEVEMDAQSPCERHIVDISNLATPEIDEDQPAGISPGFASVMKSVKLVAQTNATVLFQGESGVGKEIFARAVHRLSGRCGRPFVAINCAAIPETLIEAELFGVDRGAFTGADHARAGRFELADGGTLFLDEIAELTANAQSKLLRVLQEGEFERLGETRTRKVDARVIAATNDDLRDATGEGRFREDLFFRLNVFPIHVAPLRERREDIPILMASFLKKYNETHNKQIRGFTQQAIQAIMSYEWPGNIRELENVIERGIILAGVSEVIDAPHLFADGEKFDDKRVFTIDGEGHLIENADLLERQRSTQEDEVLARHIDDLLGREREGISFQELETLLLRKAMERTQGNISAAARMLGLTRPQMVYRLKSHGIIGSD